VSVIGVPTYHDPEKGARHGRNTIYLIEIDDVRVCHLGDLGHPLDDSEAEAISAPDVPTFKELGYDGFEDLFVANGLLAPAGASSAMTKALNREMVRMNASGPIREKLLQASYEPGTLSPEDYGAMIDRELKLWGDVVQETGVRVKA